jgi:hypothetical protein
MQRVLKMARQLKRPSSNAGIEMLVFSAFYDAAAAVGALVPDLWSDQTLRFLVEAPDKVWVQPLNGALLKAGAHVWVCSGFEDDPMGFCEMIVHTQLALLRCVWIAAPGDYIPPLVRRCADHHVRIEGLTSHTIGRTILSLTGHTIEVADEDWHGVGLSQVAEAFSCSSKATEIVDRLRHLRLVRTRHPTSND